MAEMNEFGIRQNSGDNIPSATPSRNYLQDVKNLGSPGQAGTIAGGAFLKEFVKDEIPWCHFDIAGSAWGDKKLSYQNPGSATGEIIRLVLDLLKV